MPRLTTYRQHIPAEKPDCCEQCPFLGLIPKHRRKAGSKKTMLCLATMKAMSKEATCIRESERAGTRHPFHRPCDTRWEAWWQLPRQEMGISIQAYNECRIPYEQTREYVIDFE